MTATGIMYTAFGFAIAAEGRQLWAHQPTLDHATHDSESEHTQKIFPIEAGRIAMAYVVRGDVANRDRSFDIALEIKDQVRRCWWKRFTNPYHFVKGLSVDLEQAIRERKRSGILEDYPASEISFVGYDNTDPWWIDIKFSRYNQGLRRELIPHRVYVGYAFVHGSPLIRDLISAGDRTFSEFIRPMQDGDNPSLVEATNFMKGYVEACSSRLALQLDPDNCRKVGGHIHVATITPRGSFSLRIRKYILRDSQPTGFQWLIPPLRGALPSSIAS
jgi:hypothetical protein